VAGADSVDADGFEYASIVLAAGWHDMPRVSTELTFDRGRNQTKQAAFSRAVSGLVEYCSLAA
jgi:hypothetical protein